MTVNQIARIMVNTCYNVHVTLGPGLLEYVYEEILFHEFTKQDLVVDKQKHIPLIWDGIEMGHGFRADIIIERKVLIEIKSVQAIAEVHPK